MNPLGIFALIFLASGNRNGKVDDGIAENGTETFLESDSSHFPRNFHSTTDNYSWKNLKIFRVLSPKKEILHKKIPKMTEVIEEKIIKRPSRPLHAIIDSMCQRGYQRDQNGICQKAVNVNQEKNFDLDRRRKRRYVNDDEIINQKSGKPFVRKLLEKLKGKDVIDCSKVYPGLISDSFDACKKSASFPSLDRS